MPVPLVLDRAPMSANISVQVALARPAPALHRPARHWPARAPAQPITATSDHRANGASAAAASGSKGAASPSPSAATAPNTTANGKPLAPWTLTFDLRERETLWTEENQARLVRIVASHQLKCDVAEVERRLDSLAALLPHVAARCAYIKPSTLAELLRNPGNLVTQLLSLRQLLPKANISQLAAAQPEMLLLRHIDAVRADLERLAALLGEAAATDLDRLLQEHPRFLDAELVSEVLEELRRLMPDSDPVQTLLADPTWMLRLERGQKRLGDDPD
ncbi:hypothetical protein ACK3TF_002438 [Chlorella vulgaris]